MGQLAVQYPREQWNSIVQNPGRWLREYEVFSERMELCEQEPDKHSTVIAYISRDLIYCSYMPLLDLMFERWIKINCNGTTNGFLIWLSSQNISNIVDFYMLWRIDELNIMGL